MAWTGRISLFTSGGHVCRLPLTAVHSPGSTNFSPRDTICMSLLTGQLSSGSAIRSW